jgi:hypothetical protein
MYGVANKVTGLTVSDSPDSGKKRTTVFKFSDMHVALADNAGVVAYGSKLLYTFPADVNILQSIVSHLTIGKSSAGVNADFDGDLSLGTVAANNTATLTSTEADVVASASTPQAVAGVSTFVGPAPAAAIYQDGTGGAKALYLNLLVDDADHDVTTTPCDLIINGTIEIEWIVTGVQ